MLYFPEDGGAVLPFFWLPKDDIKTLELDNRWPYQAWAEKKLLELTPGRAVNYAFVVRRLAQIAADYDLKGVAYDRWRIKAFERVMADEGVELPMHEWGQGFKDMAPAVDALEAAVLDRKLRHGGNPILRANCYSTKTEKDAAGNRKPDKRRSRDKIDGIVALCMSLGLAAREEVKKPFHFDPEARMVLGV